MVIPAFAKDGFDRFKEFTDLDELQWHDDVFITEALLDYILYWNGVIECPLVDQYFTIKDPESKE
jgi:hypothetical protein